MDQTKPVTLSFLVLFLAACLSITQGKLFSYKASEEAEPCILADVDFTLYLAAERQGETPVDALVTSEDENIKVFGNCGPYSAILELIFPSGVNWFLTFRQEDDQEASYIQLVQITPEKLFGEAVPVKDPQLLSDPHIIDLGNATKSYECPVPEVVEYEPLTVTTTTFNFTAIANVSYLHVQGFNVIDGNFSTSVLCNAAMTTVSPALTNASFTTPSNTYTKVETTLAPETTTAAPTSTSMKPTPKPTSSPKPPLKLYTVKGRDVNASIKNSLK
ncbi:hypothetical protein ElyMa_004190200 [Elysia marginata]|uniref:Lysosome-associated membrane glycoprotein 5 n=1 Tax=Elysia marginata TaxID=1093978 RepID=A0AAV4GLX8_9GAST|nr:hypothetical protein ElyMa_004190200 [Elysia marginata]